MTMGSSAKDSTLHPLHQLRGKQFTSAATINSPLDHLEFAVGSFDKTVRKPE